MQVGDHRGLAGCRAGSQLMRVRSFSYEQITDGLIQKIKEMVDSGIKDRPFRQEFSLNGFRHGLAFLFKLDRAALFVLENDSGEFAGILLGATVPDLISDNQMAVEIIWRINDKGKGNGFLLYDAFEKWAESRKVDLMLMTGMKDKNEEKLRNFYKSRGFKEMGFQFVKEI